ncbi:homeobox-leucine zipper protein HOX29-like [Panicum virgatum]|uniref:homeobox-leucine zipper protein HOX29-like n=1 Tax=Panicum virgatum TaxID=38727 RepID=UPI0019D64B4B|nr:homeobox-leucine zipper protein HOX29-like [Panicum virgatum]
MLLRLRTPMASDLRRWHHLGRRRLQSHHGASTSSSYIVEILKDRPSWFRGCRGLEVFTMLPAGNGGTIELVSMQMYAPTTLVPARDFWQYCFFLPLAACSRVLLLLLLSCHETCKCSFCFCVLLLLSS